MGFAVGVLKWWEPPKVSGGIRKNPHHDWPKGVAVDDSEALLESYIQAAQSVGFVKCDTDDSEDGQEKITLYFTASGGKNFFQHATLHIGKNRCLSKLGRDSDIEHPTNGLDRVVFYGSERLHMKRDASLRPIPRSLVSPARYRSG
jgi:hypothetical protein